MKRAMARVTGKSISRSRYSLWTSLGQPLLEEGPILFDQFLDVDLDLELVQGPGAKRLQAPVRIEIRGPLAQIDLGDGLLGLFDDDTRPGCRGRSA